MDDLLRKWFSDPVISKLIIVFVGIILIWIIVKLIQGRLVPRVKDNDRKYRVKKLSVFFGYLFTIILLIVVYYKKLGGLTIAFGVAGAGIAFALQEVIASFAGWIAIMFGGFFKTGDRVELGGIKGDVIDIGVIRTTLMEIGEWVDGDLYNGRIVRVANSFVFKEPVFNYSGDFPFLWDEIKIPVQYGSDLVLAREIFSRIANEIAGDLTDQSKKKWSELVNKYLIENAQTEPMITLTANDNWIEFVIRYVVNYKRRRLTKDAMYQMILKEIQMTEGKIKFASTTIQVTGIPEMQVKVSN